jgi:hypothetical protein
VVTFLFYLLVVVLGMLSMGFQMLASRLINREFGSTIIEWSWLISTFLTAFSAGAMLGGWISNLPQTQRRRLQIAVAASGVAALAVTAFGSIPMLKWISETFVPTNEMDNHGGTNMNTAVFLSCAALFFVPVTALSSFGPQCVGWLAERGTPPGRASGTVYGVSTLGNIAGVMLTTFVLIGKYPVSQLMRGWLVVAALSLAALLLLMFRTTQKNSPP